MTSSIERPRYFTGQLLGASDFEAEQDYHRERGRRHNRLLHGWGVVCGLDVRAAPEGLHEGRVIVSPGFALSPQGDEIFVPSSVVFDADAEAYTGNVCLAIRYAETPTTPVPATGGAEVDYSRIEEGFALGLIPCPPASHARAKALDSDWIAAYRSARTQDDAPVTPPPLPEPVEEPWVVLATLVWPASNNAPRTISFLDRRVLLSAHHQSLLARPG